MCVCVYVCIFISIGRKYINLFQLTLFLFRFHFLVDHVKFVYRCILLIFDACQCVLAVLSKTDAFHKKLGC